MSYRLHETYDSTALDDFRSLKGKGGPFEKGLFIAEGPKVTRKVLDSMYKIAFALMTPEYFTRLRPDFERRRDTTDIYLAPKSEMERVVGYPLHQGIMMAVRIPESRTIATAAVGWKQRAIVVALDSIADAENMGAIIRNAAAFGAAAILVDDQSCNPYLRRSVRVSMGTIFDIEIIRVPNLPNALTELKQILPCQIVGTTLHHSSIDLEDTLTSDSTILVFGSEGWGLRREVTELCDRLVQIPIAPNVDSLNVAIASGIFLHWFTRAFKSA